MGAAELYPPVGYAATWLVLGLFALGCAVAWPLLVVVLTRPRAPRPVATVPADPGRFRDETMAAIGLLQARHGRGELGDRATGQELARLLRGFVTAETGTDVDAMTLLELQHHRDPRLTRLAELIAGLYPPNFAPAADRVGAGGSGPAVADLQAACDRAREFVGSWR